MAAQKRYSYEPERLAQDLFVIPLPLYDGSPVNTYVSIDGPGLWLIDGGLGTELCQATLRAGLESLGHSMTDIRGLLITHGHTDHVGVADTVLANGGDVLAHRVEATEGRDLTFDPQWLHRNGLPRDAGPERWRDFAWPDPTRLLEDRERLRWGGLSLDVVWSPGHTPGLVCLYEPRRRLLFTTDHVMRRAPAPVSLRHNGAANPLGDYLQSIKKLKALTVETVLPGHGRPFVGLQQRLVNIEAEIHEQLTQIVHRLASSPATAYELLSLRALQDRRPIASRYAVSLVLARLRFLEGLGRLHRIETADTIQYQVRT